MPISQNHISSNTPMGANLFADGATFRVWAPDATAIYINGVFSGMNAFRKDTDPGLLLQKNGDGRWTGFLDGVKEGDRYKFTSSAKVRTASSAILARVSSRRPPIFPVLSASHPAIV
jgi:1,4-alpha-glucan branching enzyme